MATLKSRGYPMAALPVVCTLGLLLTASGGAGQPPSAPAPPDTPPAASGLAFSGAIHRFAAGEVDSFVVVANARNISDEPVALCCRFDFEGAFIPAAGCRMERPPVFFLIARASLLESRLDCREIVLAPGAVYADSASFQLYRPDFARCPGTLEIRGSLWAGRPGESFADAVLLVRDAIRVSTQEPAAP